MEQITISLSEARNIAFRTQVGKKISNTSNTQLRVGEIIEELGYVQIDTINVINRAHHHTLWTRIPGYSMEDIYSAQKDDRSVFEYWGHAMSYLPMKDYRFYLWRMEEFLDPYSKWEKDRLEKSAHLLKPILKRIKEEGPLCSGDFKSEKKSTTNGWWDWRPYKIALEILFWQGKLMVTERRKFQKFYDLTERVLPDWVDTNKPRKDDLQDYFCLKALSALGIANEKEIIEHIRISKPGLIRSGLQRLLENEEIVEVKLDQGDLGKLYYVLKKNIEDIFSKKQNEEAFIFSPFDNFVINRNRLKELFNFQYTLECYLKPDQRIFGYFVLPIFWKNRFVGKIDTKADRKENVLLVQQLFFEEDFKLNQKFLSSFKKKLIEFMKFQGCDSIKFVNVQEKSFPVEQFKIN